MLRLWKGGCVSLFVLALAAQTGGERVSLRGYSDEAARSEREWEAKLRAIPSPENLREYMRRLSARPHHVGSPYDKDNAEWILAKFRGWGLDAHIETFDVLFPTPQQRAVEMVEPTRFTAKLEEPTVQGDPTSGQHSEQLPSYNAYSADGDVTAPLVYVNYGIPEDYERLERLGISVKGAIVIARYGASWRGIKPKVAGEHGAVGCLIYSDPHEDGYFQGDVFPRGPYRPRDGVQRGSVMDMPVYPGDPLTPGVGATAEAKRLPLAEARTLTKIPVLPISYGDAQPLLAALGGPVAPANWRGSLPITYHIGPGPAKAHLLVKANWDQKRLYDVIARIPGASDPGEWIVRGNHHDGWVNGAEDPVSAANALLEEARALSELLKQGWKPRRTILYCVWDGEEEGLLGSTEWAEAHDAELRQHAAVYINSDSNSRGYLAASGSHTLQKFVNGVARDIEDPEKKMTAWKRLQLARIASPQSRGEARRRTDLRISALGSGSDYTVFLDHLGVASLNLSYSGEDGGGIYHSIYDDYYWYTHFSDYDFVYGRALAQTIGTAVMRLADAELLPYDFTDFADTVQRYVSELQKLLKDKQDEIKERNKEIEEGVFSATADPRKPLVPPKREDTPPYLSFAPLENGTAAITRSAERYDRALARVQANGGAALGRAPLRDLNAKLIESERRLADPAGLPNRPWFQHQIYAPGFYTGYGVKTIPAVREAIEQKQWQEADAQIARVGKILENEAALINSAAEELEKIAP
ncbi:MAG TPA: transferrin receptor-like dimerization domain-containing protein [Bryobacterales bacterium]|nr:transferrin receptor-like dimerization domain-containing protein [Bryobacterales bacterium]